MKESTPHPTLEGVEIHEYDHRSRENSDVPWVVSRERKLVSISPNYVQVTACQVPNTVIGMFKTDDHELVAAMIRDSAEWLTEQGASK